MSGAEGRSRTDTGSHPPVFEDQRISDIHCAVITDLVEHNVPVPGLVDVLFITGTETDSVLGGSYPELQGRSSHTGTANPEPVCGRHVRPPHLLGQPGPVPFPLL